MPGTSRGIRLLLEEEEVLEESGLPLIGKVAAGEPIPAQEHIESHYQVDPPCSTRAQIFCYGCRG